ncbi:energy transducer TonB [Quisquiliibacterium transsilvanicum]|uniref:Protein TonB n=1 Tax=Quisquiliibacterium transsilvanicum TaxID=1549638 RepID=A0A7W8HH28_9BURK|nr:energy transducer TonB [Quisquiliibacterium transsilvanicum]MBB5271788.1 protein TonB [Quisquiliibacterium transsilvanicum]
MNPQRPFATPSRPAILAALAALVLHAGAGFLALSVPGEQVVQPPVPLEVRFVVEAPPAAVPARQPQPQSQTRAKPERKPEPSRPPERKPEPRPAVRRSPPEQSTPRPSPSETLVADSARAAPEAPMAPAPQPSPSPPAAPLAPVDTAPAAPAPAPAPVAAAPARTAPASPPAIAVPASGPATSAPRFDAAYLANPPPAYPMISRRLGEEGRVLLRVHVEPDGRASSVELRDSSGFGRLDDAALRAVRGWRFVPARRGEQAVAAWVLVPINFTLKNS